MIDYDSKGLEGWNQRHHATESVEYYLRAALAYGHRREATDDDIRILRLLENSVQEAKKAIADNDINRFALAYGRVLLDTVKLNLPDYETDIKSKQAAKGGKGKGTSYEPLRLLAIKLYEENRPWYSTSQAAKSSKLTVPINRLASKSGLTEPKFRTIHEDWLLTHVNKNKS
jgi:hypothetical protein